MKKILVSLLCIGFFQLSLAQEYLAHAVQKGETVGSIAKKYNISENSILKLNPDVKRNTEIRIPKLIIPVNKVPDGAKKVDFSLYEVSPKETLYSISRSFELSIEEIKKYNPYLYERDLDMNDVLKIPVTKLSKDDEELITNNFNKSVTNSSFSKLKHLVLPKETKYGIAKQYGISIAQLDSLNPGVQTLQAGQFVTIVRPEAKETDTYQKPINPKTEEIEYLVVSRRESVGSILKSKEFSKERLEALNPALRYGGLSEGMVLKLPMKRKSLLLPGEKYVNFENFIDEDNTRPIHLTLLLPFNLNAFENDSIDKELLLKRNPLTRISIDFYTGVQMAIDSAKARAIPVELNVLDIEQNNPYKIKSLFKFNNLPTTDAYLGPLQEDEIKLVLKEIEDSETLLFPPLVNPNFYHKNLVKAAPRNDLKQEMLITYIDSLISPQINLVSLTDQSGFAIREKLKYTFPNVKFVSQKEEDYLQKSDIKPLLNKNKTNWFLLETTDYGKIESTIASLIALQKENYNIRLFTSNRSNFYEDEISNAYLSLLNFTFVSASKELIDSVNDGFSSSFFAAYGYYPNRFVVRGFDLAYDLILRLAYADKNFDKTLNLEAPTQYFESKFNYRAFDFEDGFYNDSLFLIQYTEDLQTQVLN